MTNNINKSNKCAGYKKTIYEMRGCVTCDIATTCSCHDVTVSWDLVTRHTLSRDEIDICQRKRLEKSP